MRRITYKLEKGTSIKALLEKYTDYPSIQFFGERVKPFLGEVEEDSFKIWYVGTSRRNSFNPIIRGELEQDGKLVIKLEFHFITKMFLFFFNSVCWVFSILILSSLKNGITQEKINGIIGSLVLSACSIVFACIGFNIDRDKILDALDGVFGTSEDGKASVSRRSEPEA